MYLPFYLHKQQTPPKIKMKVTIALLTFATVAMALPGTAEVQNGELEARIYCPGRKPPICITKRSEKPEETEASIGCFGKPWCITKRAEEKKREEENEASIACFGKPWCITKRAEEKKREEEVEASIGCGKPWCITKRTEEKREPVSQPEAAISEANTSL